MYQEFAPFYDRMMHDVDYDAWTAYLDGFLKEANARTVLDCACGTGSLAVRLAKKGYAVTGSDISADMLAVAREKAMRAGFKIPLVQQDMREISLHKPVDAVVCACDGVNYLTGDGDARAFFQAAREALAPGGLLLFDVSSAYKLAEAMGDKPFFEEAEDYTYLWANRYDKRRRLAHMRLTFFVREGAQYTRFAEEHIQRAYAVEELAALLKEENFALIGVYDAFTDQPPRDNSERIQFVCRKE